MYNEKEIHINHLDQLTMKSTTNYRGRLQPSAKTRRITWLLFGMLLMLWSPVDAQIPVKKEERQQMPTTIAPPGSTTVPPGSTTPPPGSTTYEIDMVKLHAKQAWYRGIGQDLVILKLQAYDTGGESKGFFILTAKMQDDEVLPLNLAKFFGPGAVNGSLKILGSFTITHPQHFQNVRKAMQDFANASGVALVSIGTATGEPALAIAGGALSQPAVYTAVGNFFTELLKIAGRVGCAGGDPLTYTMSNENTLDKNELASLVNQEFVILTFVKGAQAGTCAREIKYSLVSRELKK